MKKKKNRVFNLSHYLLLSSFPNWIRLLKKNKPSVAKEKIPQAALITLTTALFYPFALIEKAIWSKRIAAHKVENDPIFIVGHLRSGTTFVQNILSKDPNLAWTDPVSTISNSNCLLLKDLLTFAQRGPLKNARPMDNLDYAIDLPVEETFGLAGISTRSIIHAVAFPNHFPDYIPYVFTDDLSEEEREGFIRDYTALIRKISYIKKGKRLVLKSPDNSGHIRLLMELYPNARFINIYRDPYRTLVSTVHMFKKQMEGLRISPLPEDYDVDLLLEDNFTEIFERMYMETIDLARVIPENRFIDIRYEEFVKEPVKWLEKIYSQLELEGFDEAKEHFEAYADSQKNYVKNNLNISQRLKNKINARLGFYFEHYGYKMED